MGMRSGPKPPKDKNGLPAHLGITPGAKRSDDPDARPETEPCNLPGCNIRHATRGVRGGD